MLWNNWMKSLGFALWLWFWYCECLFFWAFLSSCVLHCLMGSIALCFSCIHSCNFLSYSSLHMCRFLQYLNLPLADSSVSYQHQAVEQVVDSMTSDFGCYLYIITPWFIICVTLGNLYKVSVHLGPYPQNESNHRPCSHVNMTVKM